MTMQSESGKSKESRGAGMQITKTGIVRLKPGLFAWNLTLEGKEKEKEKKKVLKEKKWFMPENMG